MDMGYGLDGWSSIPNRVKMFFSTASSMGNAGFLPEGKAAMA
jgi:hypothetical protein